LAPQVNDPQAPTDGLAISFWNKAQSLRTDKNRLTRVIEEEKASYNLFLFPETNAPNAEQVSKVQKELSGRFFQP